MKIDTLAIVGVGLIGGSLGLAARRRRLAGRVIGVGRSRESLDVAVRVGAVDDATTDLEAAAAESQLLVFCTPVDMVVGQVVSAGRHCRPGTLITDAGSTKAAIVRGVEGRLPGGVHFVGSHPLAGSEKRGPAHADGDLFQGRVTVVTPGAGTPEAAARAVRAFWEAVGSRVVCLSPEGHDDALAVTSHLPHLAAAALAGILPDGLQPLTATGFRDTTRVAAGDPSIWTGIFRQNRAAVLNALELLQHRLGQFRTAIEGDDAAALDALLTEGKKVRDALGS